MGIDLYLLNEQRVIGKIKLVAVGKVRELI